MGAGEARVGWGGGAHGEGVGGCAGARTGAGRAAREAHHPRGSY